MIKLSVTNKITNITPNKNNSICTIILKIIFSPFIWAF